MAIIIKEEINQSLEEKIYIIKKEVEREKIDGTKVNVLEDVERTSLEGLINQKIQYEKQLAEVVEKIDAINKLNK